jgi:hypothetical protein
MTLVLFPLHLLAQFPCWIVDGRDLIKHKDEVSSGIMFIPRFRKIAQLVSIMLMSVVQSKDSRRDEQIHAIH